MIGYNDGYRTVFLSNYPGCESETALLSSVCDNYTHLNKYLWPSNMGPASRFKWRFFMRLHREENFDANLTIIK